MSILKKFFVFSFSLLVFAAVIQFACRKITGDWLAKSYILVFVGVMFGSGVLSVILMSLFSKSQQQNAIGFFGGMFCRMILTMITAIVILITHEKSNINVPLLTLASFYLMVLPMEVWLCLGGRQET